MSTSFSSFESLVHIMNTYYDVTLPPYYVPRHLDIVVNVIHQMVRYKEIEVVVTSVILQEPIVANGDRIFISVPLVAMLVNLNVALPKEQVKFAKNFNIFQNMSNESKVKTSSSSQCVVNYQRGRSAAVDQADNEAMPLGVQFTSIEMTRIVQLLRLVTMCAHFYQHYKLKHAPPYTQHKDFDPVELAYLTKEKLLRKPQDVGRETMYRRQQLASSVGPLFASSLKQNIVSRKRKTQPR